MEAIDRIKKLMHEKGLTVEKLSEMTGISVSAINSWSLKTKNQRTIRDLNLLKIANALSVDFGYLKFGDLESEENQAINDNNIVYVKEYGFTFGCGLSFEPNLEEAESYQMTACDKSYFLVLGISPKECAIFRAHGDSMQPLIYQGDRIMVHCQDIAIVDGALYAVITKEGLMIKRIRRDRGQHTVILSSENPTYSDIVYSEQEFSDEVVHCWQVLKLERSFL